MSELHREAVDFLSTADSTNNLRWYCLLKAPIRWLNLALL